MVGPSLLITRRIFLEFFLTSILSQINLWSYDGKSHPTHWANLSPDYHTCGDGQRQSPIDIDITTATAAPIVFNYCPLAIALLNNGRTIQQAGNDTCTLTLDNNVYTLLQFHFHTPSEHTHAGIHYPMEYIWFTDINPPGALAVVSLWITPGIEQPELVALSKQLPQQAGDEINDSTAINPENLLPKNRNLVRYSGSLTTPPCSEGVTWLVMVNPIEASVQQIETFHRLLGDNARPLQRL